MCNCRHCEETDDEMEEEMEDNEPKLTLEQTRRSIAMSLEIMAKMLREGTLHAFSFRWDGKSDLIDVDIEVDAALDDAVNGLLDDLGDDEPV